MFRSRKVVIFFSVLANGMVYSCYCILLAKFFDNMIVHVFTT